MKLKKLIIHNIASIEDATIEFDGDQLYDQDLFLIYGPTGSGKSTILDAICLALFNKTPRIENSAKNLINAFDTDEASSALNNIKDVLHLVRKNAVEAWVIFSFEVDGHTYTATWRAYRIGQYRKRKSKDTDSASTEKHESSTFKDLPLSEKLKLNFKKEWTLADDEGVNYEKYVDERITEIIKMNFDQFCKTTMLAQGDFTRFLSSSADEKAQILERLVGTEKYAQVGKEINLITNEKKSEVDTMTKMLENFKFLTDEEKEQKRQSINELHAQLQEIEKQKNIVGGKLKYIDDSLKATVDEANTRAALDKAAQALLTDEAVKNKRVIELWDTTADLRLALTNKKKHEAEKSSNANSLLALIDKYRRALNGRLYIADRVKQLEAHTSSLLKQIKAAEAFEQMFDNADVICSKNDTIVKNERFIEQSAPKLEALEQTLNDLNKKSAEYAEQKANANEQIATIEGEIKSLQDTLDALAPDTIDDEASALNKHLASVKDAENALNSRNECVADLNNKAEQLSLASENQVKLSEIKKKAEAEYIDAEKAASESKAIYDKTFESVSDHAKALRTKLAKGDRCPVCNHIISELPDESQLHDALKPLQDKYEADQLKAQTLKSAFDTANNNFIAASIKVKNATDNLEAAKTRHAQSVDKLNKHCEVLDIQLDDNIDDVIQKMKLSDAEAEKAIKQRQASIKLNRNEISKRNNAIRDIRNKKLADIDKCITKLQTNIDTATRQQSETRGKIDATRLTNDSLRAELSRLINQQWQPADPSQFFVELKKAAKEFADSKSTVADNNVAAQALIKELETIDDCITALGSLFGELQQVEAEAAVESAHVSQRFIELKSEANVLAKAIESTADGLVKADADINRFINENAEICINEVARLLDIPQNSIIELRKAIEALNNAHSQAKALHDEALTRKAQFAESPLSIDDSPESLKELSLSLNQNAQDFAKNIGRLQNELDTDEQNIRLQGEQKAKLDNLRSEYAQWSTLNNYLGNTNGKNFRNIAQSFILNDLLEKANVYLGNISQRYTLFCYPGTLTIMIRDAHQGGAERAFNTLSGGETFIISLSLALGLSSMQNIDFEVDTLFIDEGFGSLSGDLLDPVINALKRLNEIYGRRVGIISHVETFRGRIPATIQVSKQGNSSSEVKVIIN